MIKGTDVFVRYPRAMPKGLLKAYRELDRAVMKLHGFGKGMAEPENVAALMQMYQELAGKN